MSPLSALLPALASLLPLLLVGVSLALCVFLLIEALPGRQLTGRAAALRSLWLLRGAVLFIVLAVSLTLTGGIDPSWQRGSLRSLLGLSLIVGAGASALAIGSAFLRAR